ncbi:MAG: hypothetical protein V4506_02185 [Bacteroidota bacterium]
MVRGLSFFKDVQLTFKFVLAIIFIKVAACFAYYWFYFIYSPGGVKGDSNDTLLGAEIIYKAFSQNKADFFKMVLGLHSDLTSDPLYENYFKHIADWGDSDSTREFFLNDNRTSTRFHALVRLFSGGHYPTHALVMLVVSFTGQFAFYKAFKSYFPGKEKLLALVIFISPSVLFWSSGILKEPLALALLGLFVYAFFKLFAQYRYRLKYILVLLGSFFFFAVLKPYILAIVLFPLILFVLVKRFQIKRVFLFYVTSLSLIYGSCVLILKYAFHKDVINTIVVRQNDFISLSKGGVFFVNDRNYLRLEYTDVRQYELIDSANYICKLKPHVSLMYWDLDHLRDTVFVADNHDTSLYKLISINKPAGSGIHMDRLQYSFSSFAKLIPLSFYNVLCRPFFYDARSGAELVASMENLIFLLFIVVCIIYRSRTPIDKNLLVFCITVVILAFLLIGITTTVTGAIVRYKVPFVPFLLMIPLLYLDSAVLLKNKVVKWFLG